MKQKPNEQDLLDLIEKMDSVAVSRGYERAIQAMQAKMQQNQEPFK